MIYLGTIISVLGFCFAAAGLGGVTVNNSISKIMRPKGPTSGGPGASP